MWGQVEEKGRTRGRQGEDKGTKRGGQGENKGRARGRQREDKGRHGENIFFGETLGRKVPYMNHGDRPYIQRTPHSPCTKTSDQSPNAPRIWTPEFRKNPKGTPKGPQLITRTSQGRLACLRGPRPRTVGTVEVTHPRQRSILIVTEL